MRLFCKLIGHKVEKKMIKDANFLKSKCSYCLNQYIYKGVE